MALQLRSVLTVVEVTVVVQLDQNILEVAIRLQGKSILFRIIKAFVSQTYSFCATEVAAVAVHQLPEVRTAADTPESPMIRDDRDQLRAARLVLAVEASPTIPDLIKASAEIKLQNFLKVCLAFARYCYIVDLQQSKQNSIKK